MPTTAILTYNAARVEPLMAPEDADMMAVTMAHVAAHFARGTILGQVTASKDFAAYASGNVDGSQVPIGILVYDIDVDSSGNITLTATTSQAGGDLGQKRLDIPIYIGGIFDCADLVGLDANAVTKLSGRLLYGTVSAGAFHF